MSKPIQGKPYVVQAGEDLRSIAAQVYGDATLWTKIKNANQTTTKQKDPESVAAGTTLNIPNLPDETSLKTAFKGATLTGGEIDDLTIFVDDVDIRSTSARIIRTIDTGADGWTAVVPWFPGRDKKLDRALLPYRYNPATVFIGGKTVINGILYTVIPELTRSGRIKNLEGWSYTADAIDSTLKPPYERNNVTLESLAAELLEPIGIKAVFNDPSGGQFKRVSANQGDTVFAFLAKLATQRGLLLSSTPDGDALFTKSASGSPVGTLVEGQPGVVSWSARYDGRQRFNVYRAIGQSPGDNAKAANAIDTAVPRTRSQTFTVDDTVRGDIQDAANWRRSKALADALTIPLPVTGWIAPNGDIWRENTIITVISETLHLPNGFDLLIRSVEYIFENNGKTATLNLVPPQVYTGEELVEPWA